MKKILFFTAIIISFFIINNLIHTIIATWQKQEFVTEAQKQLQAEETHHQQLEQQLQHVSQSAFIEEQAHDKLLLVKPGEQMILLPSETVTQTKKSTAPEEKKPNWQQWQEYFFG